MTNKIPIVGIIGEKESLDNTITLKFLGKDNQLTLKVEDAIELIKKILIVKALIFYYNINIIYKTI
jgi:threonyl-tRNA synthetase